MTNSNLHVISEQNKQFWDELCGTHLANRLGITEINLETLKIFDDAYFGRYPYLKQYVDREKVAHKTVLEIGLGFGTLSQYLMEQRANYYGLDIAQGPVSMVQDRQSYVLDTPKPNQIVQGSALKNPFPDEYFDFVYSIGALHHTGDTQLAIDEVYRVLKPGGKAIVMLYNRDSFRQRIQVDLRGLLERRQLSQTEVNSLYDRNTKSEVAPHIDYFRKRDLIQLFSKYTKIECLETQNSDPVFLPKMWIRVLRKFRINLPKYIIKREDLLNNLGRWMGLDWYIVVRK